MSALRLKADSFGPYRKGDLIEPRDQKHMREHHAELVEEVSEDQKQQTAESAEKAQRTERTTTTESGEGQTAGRRAIVGPGETVEISGQYVQIAGNGRMMKDQGESTLVVGEPAPPSKKPGWRWKVVDATAH